jgi:cytochrome oxidase Cu insertion factor (SCO1/SenC/PrrC family)
MPDSGNPEQANDFTYSLASGEQQTLYALQSEMILLYFYDPTCEECHLLMSQLAASDIINRLIDKKKLIVLAVYPDDDIEIWNEYAGHIPQQWINGYDKGVKIHTEGIFLIKSFPTLYLLDKDKMIRMKEMTFKALEFELGKIVNN